MSRLQLITESLSAKAQGVIPNPNSKAPNLPEKSIQRRLDRFYEEARGVRAREKLGIFAWARVLLGLRQKLLVAGYPAAVVSPLIRSTLIQAATGSTPAVAEVPPASAERGAAAAKPHRGSDGGSSEEGVSSASWAPSRIAKAKVLMERGKRQQAVAIYRDVLGRDPGNLDALYGLGVAEALAGDHDAAIEYFERVVATKPGDVQTLLALAVSLQTVHRFEDALARLDELLGVDPDSVPAYIRRALCCVDIGRFDEVLAAAAQVLRVQPGHGAALALRAIALDDLHRFDEAMASFEAADAAFEADSTKTTELEANRWNKSLFCLRMGRYQEGWDLYDYRRSVMKWKLDPSIRAREEWNGTQDLRGKSIIIVGEQGLGDQIQFARYLPQIKAKGGAVILHVPPPLGGLMRTLEGVDEVVENGQVTPEAEYWTALLSLPRILGTTVETIPAPARYLAADPAKVEAWARTLGPRKSKRVGLVWTGNLRYQNDTNRSTRLRKVIERLPEGLEFISLQKELRPIDGPVLEEFGRIRYFGDKLGDFTDTAALCELVDVVVSVDTSVAHLAAALGRPTWIMLPYHSDWRWLLDRTDSPWYPSVRLFRQGQDRSWEPVLEAIGEALKGLKA